MARSAQQYTEALNRMGETVIETTRQIAEINVKAGEKLLEQQAELMSQLVNCATRNVDFASKAMGWWGCATNPAALGYCRACR